MKHHGSRQKGDGKEVKVYVLMNSSSEGSGHQALATFFIDPLKTQHNHIVIDDDHSREVADVAEIIESKTKRSCSVSIIVNSREVNRGGGQKMFMRCAHRQREA